MKRMFCSALVAAALFAGCGDEAKSVLSSEGESCTKRADCEGGLLCFGGVCRTAGDAGAQDGGPVVTGPSLGQRGETCTVAADCDQGLVCVAVQTGSGAIGLGRCDLANYNLTPTGKTCWAECTQHSDCCELPVGMEGGDGNVVNSCADLVKSLGDNASGCESASLTAAQTRDCFLYKSYCDCADSWECNNNRCEYKKACQNNGETVKGCPAISRSGRGGLPTTCAPATNRCSFAAATGCSASEECVGKGVVDSAGEICATGECVCVSYGCYRKCNDQLDCEHGYVCGEKKVCVLGGECETDAFCKKLRGNVAAVCRDKICKVPCESDHDCSPSGVDMSEPFNGSVCSAGFCADIGCSSNDECYTQAPASPDGGVRAPRVKMFCAAPPAGSSSPVYRSAITY